MGTFISTISQQKDIKYPENSTWSQPLQKIKQYHGMFKYVCDCFVINNEQFKQIFGSLDKAKTWDPQSIGKIDALQIFCGLIMFAKQASFKKKISFLFSIFDFNQIKSLSFIDVQVIILNICNSVYKILNKNGKVNSNQIADWLANYFHKKQRIKITRLYKFCLQNNDIKTFFKYICQNIDSSLQFPISQQDILSNLQIKSKYKVKLPKPKSHSLVVGLSQKSKQQIQINLQWHRDLINKVVKVQSYSDLSMSNTITNYQNKFHQNNYGCKISWVYGINTMGNCKPFIPLKKLGNCILYRTSSMAIVHDLQLSRQYIIQGHQQQLSCVAYNQKYEIIATVQFCQFPNINLWRRIGQGNQLKKHEQFIKYASIPTNHSKGIKLIQFVCRETLLATVGIRQHDSPIILYNFIKEEVVHQIIIEQNINNLFNPSIFLQKSQVNVNVFDTFFALSSQSNTIYEIILKKNIRHQQKQQQLSSSSSSYTITQQIIPHSYYQKQKPQKPNHITCAIACYLNTNNPYLRSYRDRSISMLLITGHESGTISQLTISNTPNGTTTTNPKSTYQQIITGLQGTVTCLQVSNNILAISAGSCVYVYELEIFCEKIAPIMIGNVRNREDIDLLSYEIKYFDFVRNFILVMTETGEFLRFQTNKSLKLTRQYKRQISLGSDNNNTYQKQKSVHNNKFQQIQQLDMSLVGKMSKLSGNNIFCILDCGEGNQLIILATNGNKILVIDSQTHQIQNVWEINTFQNIVVLDAVCSDQGICYVICACKSGRLYIRIGWTQPPKYYDCGSQIIDAKISKDCSYLLVATSNNYLLFFAKVNNNFTSPRKLLFQYETPCSINFLDNFKFFLVITSAKNSYLIQIPQLKDKKLHKQTQKISISKINIKYPYFSQKKNITYSVGCIGGSMKFSLLAMRQKDIYFFNSHDGLQRGNYTTLSTHKCPVSQIAVNQLQNKFYSLGQNDNTLIQWQVFDTKYKNKKSVGYYDKNQLKIAISQNILQFQDLQQFASTKNFINQQQSLYRNLGNCCETYYFKGTKLQKINQTIQKYYNQQYNKPNTNPNNNNPNNKPRNFRRQQKTKQKQQDHVPQITCTTKKKREQQNDKLLKKRAPAVSLVAEQVYGFETHHKNSISYTNNGTQLMGYSSRFIIRMNIKTKKQIIYEPTSKKISFLLRSQYNNQILYCVVEQKPMIYLLYKEPLKTTHHKGIIHLSIYKNYVLSYGISQSNGYSLNLHNYTNGELLYTAFTDIKVCEFIVMNQDVVVSLNQVRIWEYLYPSQPIVIASTGCLMPNKKDILLGLYDGRFAILSDRGIFHLHNQMHEKAHQSAIDVIKIKQLQRTQSQSDISQNFQIISIGRDQKIKIWTKCFQIKVIISFKNKNNLIFLGEAGKQVTSIENIRVKCMDIHKNKLLIVLHTGNIIQVQLQKMKKSQNNNNKQNQQQTNKYDNQTFMNIPSFSQKSFSIASLSNYQSNDSSSKQMRSNELIYKWKNIYQLHSIRSKNTLNRRTFFSINPVYPLIATSACDFQLIIRNYLTNQILYKLYYQKIKVQCLKFSPKGNLLAVGFNNGQTQIYKVKIYKDQAQKIQNIILETSQIFKQYQNNKNLVNRNQNMNGNMNVNGNGNGNGNNTMMMNMSMNMNISANMNMNNVTNVSQQDCHQSRANYSIINMEFSPCSIFFAVSYVFQLDKRTQSYIVLYRQSSSISTVNQTPPNPNPNININPNTSPNTNSNSNSNPLNINSNNPNPNPNNPNNNNINPNIMQNNQNQVPCYSQIDIIEISSNSQQTISMPFKNSVNNNVNISGNSANSINSHTNNPIKQSTPQTTNTNTKNKNYPKYTKSSYFIEFLNQSSSSAPPLNPNPTMNSQSYTSTSNNSNKNIIKSSNSSQINNSNNPHSYNPMNNSNILSNTTKKQQLKLKNQKNHTYLIIYEQYIDGNRIRINTDNKIKIKVYRIEDKAIYKQDYNINFMKIKFHHFVLSRVYRNFDGYGGVGGLGAGGVGVGGNDNQRMYYDENSSGNVGKDNFYNLHKNQQEIKFGYGYGYEKQDQENIISQMAYIGQNIIYGDVNGKLHIVKLNSLLMNKQQSSPSESANQNKHQNITPTPSNSNQNSSTTPTSTSTSLQRSMMNLSKTYCSHTSFINQLQLSPDKNYLFVSGSIDDCIVKYKIIYQDQSMDLDNRSYPIYTKDVNEEYIDHERFYGFLNNIDPIRDQISDIMFDVQEQVQGGKVKALENFQGSSKRTATTKLETLRIYGRRAFDKRNNLFEDLRGNLVYSLGPNIIIQDPFNPQNQKHIPIDPNPYSNSPQISTFTMNQKYLIAATQQQNSRIFVWDIYSMTCIAEMKLKNFSIIYHIVQSSSHKAILLYGINSLLQTGTSDKFSAVIAKSTPDVGKSKIYVKQAKNKMGISLSHVENNILSIVCSSFGLTSSNMELSNVTFMAVKFVQDLIITGCENGYIYIFKNFDLVCQMKIHQNAIRTLVVDGQLIFSGGVDGKVCISLISIDQTQKYTLKKVEQHSIKSKPLIKDKLYNNNQLTKQSKIKKTPNINIQHQQQQKNINYCTSIKSENQLLLSEQVIQSIVLAKNSQLINGTPKKNVYNYNDINCIKRIFVGTRSGNILCVTREFSFESQADFDRNKRNNGNINNVSVSQSNKAISRTSSVIQSSDKVALSNGVVQPILWAHDSDTISSICFDQNKPDLFYVLTFSGVLQIWSLKTLKRLYSYKLAQQAYKVFNYKQYIIINCQRSILTVKIDLQQNTIRYIKQMSVQYEGIITDCCLSKICTIGGQTPTNNKDQSSQRQSNNPNSRSSFNQNFDNPNKGAYLVIGLKKSQFNQIIINQISSNQIREKFVVVNLKYEIEFMDFSRDCRYLLFKDSFQELGMVNLENYKRINTIFVEMGIEWQSEGIRISPHGQKIYCSYSRQNKITALRRISDKQIIIGDEMGTLRIFEYPCPEQKIGQLHSHCYTKHMNFIKNIEIHPSEPYALSTSVYDRSLILWRILRAQDYGYGG